MIKKWTICLVLLLIIAGLLSVGSVSMNKSNDTVKASDSAADSTLSTDVSSSVDRPSDSPLPAEETVTQDGVKKNGLVTEGGVSFYYVDGVLQKDTVAGNDEDGYYYANADGVVDMGYCDGVTVNDEDWNVINGKATRSENEWDATLHSALQMVAKCTDSSMSKDEKLRKSFEYLQSSYLEGVPHDPPYLEDDWPVVDANDLFIYGKGDCFSYGAAFAFIGKAIGYEECYACNTGGHGWAEIDGLYYDPEWDMHSHEYNHFGVSPDDPCDVDYSGSLQEDWMRRKV